MSELYRLVAQLGLDLHPDRIAAIAVKIASLKSLEEFDAARESFGPNINGHIVEQLANAWNDSNHVSPLELAAALKAAAATSSLLEKKGAIELVWTGPSTGQVPVRHTAQVLCQVIDSAEKSLFIVSFVAYEVPLIMGALRRACNRKTKMNFLLESSVGHGGKIAVDSIDIMKKTFPLASVYAWGKKAGCQKSAAVHAKCAVSDGKIAFLTSANLSDAAMERNMELGVLIKGGYLPDVLHRHLEALVTTKVVEKV